METVRKLILTRKPGVDEIDIKAAEEKLKQCFQNNLCRCTI